MHLRWPSIDQGKQAFLWAVFFFLLLWVGMLALACLRRDGADPLARGERRDLSLRSPPRRLATRGHGHNGFDPLGGSEATL